MKLSTKSKYGLKACYELALRYNSPVSLNALQESTGTTVKYLEQIMLILRRHGIVQADRGVNGGYYLTREPGTITVGEVLNALENDFKIMSCIGGRCDNILLCPTHGVWQRIYTAINDSLRNYTLRDMIEDSEAKK